MFTESLLSNESLHHSILNYIALNEAVISSVEAGSNTSTVTLRVVGVDEKGSLESETVMYGPSPKELGPKIDCAGEVQR
jgi:hypothetical protein